MQLPSRRDSLNEGEGFSEPIPSTNKNKLPEATQERLILETSSSSYLPSEESSTQPTTPSSAVPPQQSTPKINASGRPNVPPAPIIPAIPNLPVAQRPTKRTSASVPSEALNAAEPSNSDHLVHAEEAARVNGSKAEESAKQVENTDSPSGKAVPKSWADLVRTKAAPTASKTAQPTSEANIQANGFVTSKTRSLADALNSFDVKNSSDTGRLSFLEPRGLVNTGNMCYMNSVNLLQSHFLKPLC